MNAGSRQFPPIPATFRHSSARQFLLALGFVLFFVMLVSWLSLEELTFWMIALLAILIAIPAWALIRRTGSVTIDAEGIRRTGWLGSQKSIRWADLTVQSDWTRGHLLLGDALGEHRFLLDSDLQGFDQAVEMVRSHRPDLFKLDAWLADAAGSPSLRLSSPVPLIMSLLAIVLIILGFGGIFFLLDPSLPMRDQDPLIRQLMLVVVLPYVLARSLPLSTMLKQPLFMYLDRRELVARYLAGERRFLAQDIQDVRLEAKFPAPSMSPPGKDRRHTEVTILPNQGKELRLIGAYNRCPWLYCVLKTWWEGPR